MRNYASTKKTNFKTVLLGCIPGQICKVRSLSGDDFFGIKTNQNKTADTAANITHAIINIRKIKIAHSTF